METLIDEGSEGGQETSIPVAALQEFKLVVQGHQSNWRTELMELNDKLLNFQEQEVRESVKEALPELMRQAFTKYLLFHSRLSAAMAVVLPDDSIAPSHALVSVVQSLTPQ
eukprot:Protomagalhaensia_wolfi_Nauph_80__6069@NODE_851_length_1947_cov_9_852725_g639_i0_p2_GENE_NODE_851_length_1947_cov_9_852725_g639_i0NODE_851_length_1947_cov_9_852725_g639_i0_p2_ORF_typecomplete_len129_score35_41ActivatorTraM/PF11657_8/0_061_NODE_851_length_1947_cov_9_852725_g639_i015601892